MYFDNAATTFPKPEVVYQAIEKAQREYGANPGRSGHRLSLQMDREIYKARETITKLIGGTDPFHLIFTKNCTEALNIAIKGSIREKCHVITTAMEHNSVLRPLFTLKDKGIIDLTVIPADHQGMIDPEDIKKAIREDTKLCVTTAMSNLTGSLVDFEIIGQILKEHDIIYILDAAQAVGYLDVNMSELPVDIICFPGHKSIYGPMGTGALYFKEGIELNPIIEGGTGSRSTDPHQPNIYPDKLESGTENGPGIVGFGRGAQYLLDYGVENIRKEKDELKEYFIKGLKEISNVLLYGPLDHRQGPVVSLNIEGEDSSLLAADLDQEFDIATRAGAHCAPLAHEALGTVDRGMVRFSFSIFNTKEEIDKALEAISILAARKE